MYKAMRNGRKNARLSAWALTLCLLLCAGNAFAQFDEQPEQEHAGYDANALRNYAQEREQSARHAAQAKAEAEVARQAAQARAEKDRMAAMRDAKTIKQRMELEIKVLQKALDDLAKKNKDLQHQLQQNHPRKTEQYQEMMGHDPGMDMYGDDAAIRTMAARSAAAFQEKMARQDTEFKRYFEEHGPGASPFGVSINPIKMQKELQGFMKEEFPHMLEETMELQRSRKPEHREELREIQEFAGKMRDLRHADPEAFEFEKKLHDHEQRAQEVANAIREATDEKKRGAMTKELKALLGQIFELRGESREREARQIQAELEKIKSILEKREKNREIIIQQRMDQLLGKRGLLDW